MALLTTLTRYELGDALSSLGERFEVTDEAWDRFCALKNLVEIAKSDPALIGPAVFAGAWLESGQMTPAEAIAYVLHYGGRAPN